MPPTRMTRPGSSSSPGLDGPSAPVPISPRARRPLMAPSAVVRSELIAAFDAADADDATRVVIVTGAGRAFCAGADLSAGTKTFDGAQRGRQIGADRGLRCRRRG